MELDKDKAVEVPQESQTYDRSQRDHINAITTAPEPQQTPSGPDQAAFLSWARRVRAATSKQFAVVSCIPNGGIVRVQLLGGGMRMSEANDAALSWAFQKDQSGTQIFGVSNVVRPDRVETRSCYELGMTLIRRCDGTLSTFVATRILQAQWAACLVLEEDTAEALTMTEPDAKDFLTLYPQFTVRAIEDLVEKYGERPSFKAKQSHRENVRLLSKLWNIVTGRHRYCFLA